MVGFLALAAFGPYLVGGVRTEQATVYVFTLAALLALPHLKPSAWSFLLPWAGILLMAAVTLVAPVIESVPWEAGSLVSGLDNFLLPVAVMLIAWTLVKRAAAVPALTTVARVVVWASVLNAIVAIASTRVDLSAFLRVFWGSAGTEETTAANAETMGRFSGIFNQPAEAGVVYSLALLLAVWLYRRRPGLLYPALAVLTVGSILTVSKIVLFIGLPLAAWYLFRSYRLGGKLLTVGAVGGVFAVVAGSGFVQEWEGFDYFTRLFEVPQGDAVDFYTAGRWAEGSPMLRVVGEVLASRPLNGFGFAGLEVAYDSAWTEVIVVAGLFGAALLAVVFVQVFRYALGTADQGLRRLFVLVALLLAGGSLGLPVLTANRVATLVWLVVALLVLARTPRGKATA